MEKMYLITKWFGTFLCNKSVIKNKILFPKDEKEIAKRLKKIDKGEMLAEEKKLTKDIEVTVNEKRLQKLGDYNPKDSFFKEMEIKPEDYGFSQDLLHNASLLLTEEKTDDKLKSEDLQIVQMVNALDDLVQTSNLLSERLDSWSLIPTPSKKIQPFENLSSMVNKEAERLEKQIDEDMQKIAPNTSALIGPVIGARMIALAGGLERLAFMPASTIQILGAEKALFRFKKEGGRPPKHGVIFQHPSVNKAPPKDRGKIARAFAAKIAIAVKADVFTKRDISDTLKEDLEKRLKEIRSQ
jgi:nucleolar protein 56